MAHLAEVYRRDLNVEANKPVLRPHFFPIGDEKYITIHNSNKVPTKNYSYWNDVVKILKVEFDKRDVKIFQIGTQEDPLIEGVDAFFNNTTFKQSCYIIQNAMCHVGIDSGPVHIASALDIPTVSIYAHTYAASCKPLWNEGKASIIESDRGGKKPSFSNYEDPKMINLINPEEIANECFKRLNYNKYKTQETVFIGEEYTNKIIDIIPSSMPTRPSIDGAEVRIRMDIVHNEQNMSNLLKLATRPCEIITTKEINTQALEFFKSKISKVVYFAEEFSDSFLEYLRVSGIQFELNCLSKEKLSEQRNKFFNYDIVYLNPEEEAEKLRDRELKLLQEKAKVSSGKYYLVGDQICMTLGNDHNELKFWLDAPHFRIYLPKDVEERKLTGMG